MMNRWLSMDRETSLIANELNMYPNIEKNQHHAFLKLFLRKRKRFFKWAKKNDDYYGLDAIKFFLNTNTQKAKEALSLLNQEQIKDIVERYNKIISNTNS